MNLFYFGVVSPDRKTAPSGRGKKRCCKYVDFIILFMQINPLVATIFLTRDIIKKLYISTDLRYIPPSRECKSFNKTVGRYE